MRRRRSLCGEQRPAIPSTPLRRENPYKASANAPCAKSEEEGLVGIAAHAAEECRCYMPLRKPKRQQPGLSRLETCSATLRASSMNAQRPRRKNTRRKKKNTARQTSKVGRKS